MVSADEVRKKFEAAGFEVTDLAPGGAEVEVRKYNCTRRIARAPRGDFEPSGPPCFLVRGATCELEDRGYQKFWLSGSLRFPVRKDDLRALHRFDEEVRALLGEKSLYNESLGTTCARSAYDRLAGRRE